MDWAVLSRVNRTTFVDGFTNNVNNSSKSLGADWDHDGVASVLDFLATNETFSGVEGDGAHVVATQVLGDFQHEAVTGSLDFERVQNWWQSTFELDIDDGTDDL